VVVEGWTLIQFGAGAYALFPGNDNGVDYWDINCGYSGGAYYHVALPSSDFTDPTGWTATLRAKVNQANAGSAYLRSAMSTADGNGNSWAYVLGGGADPSGVFYLDTGQNSVQLSTSVIPDSGYHYYQVIYPGAGGSGSANYYVDGVLVAVLLRTQVLGGGTGTDSGLYFGCFGTAPYADYTDTEYAQVSLQTGSH